MINTSGLDNSVFAPQAPITGDNTNFAKNLSAIINPTQALEQKQNEQIAKSVADLQMSSIYPEIQNKFLEQREQYISDYKDALRSHRGMGRLKLSPQEQLNFDRRKADMQNYVAWGKGATSSLSNVLKDVMTAQKSEHDTIDMAEYQKWWEGYKDKIKKSKNGGDVPDAYSDFINANLIHPKVKPEDLIKQENELDTNKKNMFADVLEPVNDTKGELKSADIAKVARNVDNLSPAKLARYGGADKSPDEQKQAILQQALDHRKQKEETPAWANFYLHKEETDKKDAAKKTDLDFVDNPQIGGKTMSLEEIPSKWHGQHTYTDSQGKKQTTAASGDITKVDVTPNGINAIINVKYQRPVLDEDGKPTKDGNGKTVMETAEDVKQEPVTPSLISKLKKSGYNTDKLEKEYDDLQSKKNAPAKKWSDPSGGEHTLESIKTSWKKKYGKDITNEQLTKVLSSLKAK
jgi:hypothetical protein